MRTFLAFALVAMVALAASVSRAEEPQQKEAQAPAAKAQQAEQQPAQNKTAAKDTNYRFFNGQWWYWMPQSKNWKVWDGRQWNDFQGSQTRTFSFEEPAQSTFNTNEGNYSTYGRSYNYGYSNYPNNRIIGSFGFRGAGSKAEGRY